MKKFTILLCLLLFLSIGVSAFAVNPKIIDDAGLLTVSQISILESKALKLEQKYGMDVAILTVESLNGRSATAVADDYFDYNGYGSGSERSGVLFMICPEDRDYAISTSGKCIDALTDYGLEQLFDSISDDLAEDDYYRAFSGFLTELPNYFDAYEAGEPIDRKVSLVPFILVGLVIGLIAAGITVWVMASGMNTAKPQRSAQSYVSPGTFRITAQRNIFLYSNVSKVRKAETSSGGSSTHIGSSGRTHGGRSGKY